MTASNLPSNIGRALGELWRRVQILEAVPNSTFKVYAIKLFQDDEPNVAGPPGFQFAIPAPLNGTRMTYVFAYNTTKDSGANVVATVTNKGPDTTGSVNMMSTDITIDADTFNTEQGTPPIPDPANNQVVTGDQIYVEITDDGDGYSMGFGYELWFS